MAPGTFFPAAGRGGFGAYVGTKVVSKVSGEEVMLPSSSIGKPTASVLAGLRLGSTSLSLAAHMSRRDVRSLPNQIPDTASSKPRTSTALAGLLQSTSYVSSRLFSGMFFCCFGFWTPTKLQLNPKSM